MLEGEIKENRKERVKALSTEDLIPTLVLQLQKSGPWSHGLSRT